MTDSVESTEVEAIEAEAVEAVETEEVVAVAEAPVIEEGSTVKIGRKKYTVVRAGKECKLEHSDGSQLWRHSRTVARLQAEKTTA